jgi:hypothetical protein
MAGKQGKGARAKAKLRRLKEKRAKKQSMQTIYQKWRDDGVNQKSKRARKNARKNLARNISHPDGPCGNPGCVRCHGIHFRPYLQDGVPVRMPQWMFIKWNQLTTEERRMHRD